MDNAAPAAVLSSISLILLTFFLFLNSLSSPDPEKREQAIRSVEERFERSAAEQNAVLRVASRLANPSFSMRVAAIRSLADEGGAAVAQEPEMLRVVLPAEELFQRRDQQIDAHYLTLLSEIARQLKSEPLALEIQVHAAAEPGDSGEMQREHWQRTVKEAASLYRFFHDQGIAPERLAAAGHGAGSPRFSAAEPAGRVFNRRAELRIVPEQQL